MRQSLTLVALTTACIAAPLTMSGCLVGQHHSTQITGAYVQPADLSRVTTFSSTTDDVRQLLGEPTEKITNEHQETWTWNWHKREEGSGHLFLIFNGSSSKDIDESAHITFEHGIVIKKWRD